MKTKNTIALLFLISIAVNSFAQKMVWKSKAELPDKIHSGTALTCQDKIYFVGGQKDLGSGSFIASNSLYEYHLALDEWIEKTPMPTARFNLASACVENKIYVIGGDYLLDKNEMYDPASDTWQTLAPMPCPRQHIKAAVVDNKIYIIGGLESSSTVSTKNQVYDPQTNTWQELAPIPKSKHNYSTVVYNDKIYIFGGDTQDGGDIWAQTSSVEVYDPATNSWDTAAPLPTFRFNPGIGIINDKIIITGGYSDDEVIADVDIFDPITEYWTQANFLPKKNLAMGSTVLNDKIYIIGGTGGPPNWVGYQTVYEGTLNNASNLTPELYKPIEDDSCMLNEFFYWILPDFTFVDDDTLTYTASLANGNVLPNWLVFNNGVFTGVPESEETIAITIIATDNYGASVSDTFNLTIHSELIGIEQITVKDNLIIYPQPCKDDIHIYWDNALSKIEQFQLYTIDGQFIKEGGLKSNSINVSDLNKGLFIIRIKTKEKIITKKLIVE